MKQKELIKKIEEIHNITMNHADSNSRHSIQRNINTLFSHSEFWSNRMIPGLSSRSFNYFKDYVSYQTPWGLDWNETILKAYLLPECKELWQQIEDQIPAANFHGGDNTKVTHNVENRGNSREYKISVLKRDAPEIAKQVIEGKISGAEGMRMAGKWQPEVRHPATLEGYYNSIQKKLNKAEIAQLKLML